MGQAMVAGKPGSEGIWWNPASIGGQQQKELAIHHSKTVAGVGDALSFILPTSLGITAFSVNILNLGDQALTGVFPKLWLQVPRELFRISVGVQLLDSGGNRAQHLVKVIGNLRLMPDEHPQPRQQRPFHTVSRQAARAGG